MILAIDPGSEKSGWVVLKDGEVLDVGVDENRDVIEWLGSRVFENVEELAIECPKGYRVPNGRPFHQAVIETAIVVGRFMQEWISLRGTEPALLFRDDVKKHILGRSSRVGDKEVRRALIERWGGDEKVVKGTKASPGPLYGVASHAWAALAVGLTYYETR